jgi:hypothetical protein
MLAAVKQHRVRAGDCLSSIAYETGFFWETLWDHPTNVELKQLRESPFTLVPGDEVTIPELRAKLETVALDQRHTFRRRGVPAKLVLRLLRSDGSPRADEPYMLEVDGLLVSMDKQTDAEGVLTETIQPSAKHARLYFNDGAETYELALGQMQPGDTIRGVQARLKSLGFYDGPVDGREGPRLTEAIARFRLAHELDPSSDSKATQAAIAEAHDG